jgi:hypothetical protein
VPHTAASPTSAARAAAATADAAIPSPTSTPTAPKTTQSTGLIRRPLATPPPIGRRPRAPVPCLPDLTVGNRARPDVEDPASHRDRQGHPAWPEAYRVTPYSRTSSPGWIRLPAWCAASNSTGLRARSWSRVSPCALAMLASVSLVRTTKVCPA